MRGGACLFCWNLLRGWGSAVIHVMGVGGEESEGVGDCGW
jgi:hypothetical protein